MEGWIYHDLYKYRERNNLCHPLKIVSKYKQKITDNGLISPLALYIECGNPVISTPLL